MAQIHLLLPDGQSYQMVSRPERRDRRVFLAPIFILTLAVSASWYFVRPPFSQLTDSERVGRQPTLKGSVKKADRLPAWLRERAVDRLPFYTNRSPAGNATNSDLPEVNDALNAARKWAFHSKKGNSSMANSLVVDVISIGSVNRLKYMHAQQKSWAAFNKHSVRNMFMATETNIDNALAGSCQELLKLCAASNDPVSKNDTKIYTDSDDQRRRLAYNFALRSEQNESPQQLDGELCIQRRMGLAMGASVGRYRKIIHALTLGRSNSNVEHGSNDDNLKYTMDALPNYLIITFDSAYFNTERLMECMGRENNLPTVYSPSISWTDVNLSDKNQESVSHQQEISKALTFAYPTNNTGVVFNKQALEIWIRRVACFAPANGTSSTAGPIRYDSKTSAVEYHICKWMYRVLKKDRKVSQSRDAFETAIHNTLLLSRSAHRDNQQAHTNPNEFQYSSIYQSVSISAIFSIYASTLQMLCTSVSMGLERIPTGEEMLGYLIRRFGLSRNGLSVSAPDADSTCKSSASDDECSPDSMVACANLSLKRLSGI